MAELKTQRNDGDVNEFLASIKDDQRRTDCLALLDIMKKLSGEEPAMWGKTIVGFGSYPFKYATGREGSWFRTGFSPRKQNLTLYIMPGFDSYGELMEKLGRHKTGKSCLYVKNLADVHLPTLKKLVKNSLRHMSQKYGD